MSETVVITGGSSGIGLASARTLASKGYRVVVAARSQERINKALEQISGEASGIEFDNTHPKRIQDAFNGLEKVDHLVLAGAGPAAWGSFAELSADALAGAFATKFWGYFYCAQAVLPKLTERGSITFVTGAAARMALPGAAGVAAVNGALNALALTLAKELAPRRVNAVSPGLTRTPAYDYMGEAERKTYFERMGASLPVGRVAQPEEIADAVRFVVSNQFVTGTVLDVDGGVRLG